MSELNQISKELLNRLRKVWKDHSFQFGVPVIDLQHIYLLYTFLDLGTVLDEGHKNVQGEYDNAFSRIMEFTSEHFFLEAEIFRKLGFHDDKEHLKQHGEFINKLKKRSSNKVSGSPLVARQLVGDLMSWLFDHILIEDVQYEQFYRTQGPVLVDFTENMVRENEIYITPFQVELYKSVTGFNVPFKILDENIYKTIYHMWRTYDLSIQIPVIDIQHMWIIYLMIKIDRASRNPSKIQKAEELRQGYRQFRSFMIHHFNTEERIMEQFEYPDYLPHKSHHNILKNRMNQWDKNLERGDDRFLYGLSHVIKDWLMSHIAINDKDLLPYFRTRKEDVKHFCKVLIQTQEVKLTKGQINLHRQVTTRHRSDSIVRTEKKKIVPNYSFSI